MEQQLQLNEHNKQEYPPMHTVEHILNRTMMNLFGCGRAVSAHIERKKSKCDYLVSVAPTDEQIREIERRVNEVINMNLPVTFDYISKEDACERYDLGRLPDDVSDILRVVHVGGYDDCLCVGLHVNSTFEIGKFVIISHDYQCGRLRLRFKLMGG
ncbi:hypothetical protein [Coprobacter sp.]